MQRIIVLDRKTPVRSGTVVARNARNHVYARLTLADIDAKDASWRVGGMESLADEHTRNGEIVGITARTGRFLRCVYKTYVFFFQAEDGIRALTVTGVQTCALPISAGVSLVPERAGTPLSPAGR